MRNTVKTGRRPLGEEKRKHNIMIRLNSNELKLLQEKADFYRIDISKRGQQGPFCRKIFLASLTSQEKHSQEPTSKELPNDLQKVAYEIHKIGNNINQVTKKVNQISKQYGSPQYQQQMDRLLSLVHDVNDTLNTLIR